jgi:signal transduction histidine kinase
MKRTAVISGMVEGTARSIRLTRYFALASGIILVIAAIGLIRTEYYTHHHHLHQVTQKSARTLSHAFVNSLWPQMRGFIANANGLTADQIRHLPRTAAIRKAIETLTEGTRVAEIKLLSPDGLILYSTNPRHIGTRYDDESFFNEALASPGVVVDRQSTQSHSGNQAMGTMAPMSMGNAAMAPGHDTGHASGRAADQPPTTGAQDRGHDHSGGADTFDQVREFPKFESMNGVVFDHHIYSRYMPLRIGGPDGKIAAVMEIYLDITDMSGFQDNNIKIGASAIGAAFAAMFVLLIVVVWRGERIMQRHRAYELELTAGIARAEAASRSKSEFLATMSHELRTPLNAIIGFADMIRRELLGPVGNESYKQYAEDIHNSGAHLLDVINDVLDLARVESGQMALNFAPADIPSLIKTASGTMRDRASRAGIRFAVGIDSSLPSVKTDGGRLNQILLNLLSNAVKFTPKGGEVVLSATFDAVTERIVLRVRDTGIGISAQDLPVALAPFGQVDSSLARKYEGTGLGLPLSRKFAEALGGTLDIESQPGSGTTVTVTLPVRQPGQERKEPETGGGAGRSAIAA